MIIYVFLLILFLSSFLFFNFLNEKNINIKSSSFGILFLGCALCILIGGFRWETGTDWNSYYFFFADNTTFEQFTKYNSFEIGWTFLNWVIKNVFPSYTIFLLFFHSFNIIITWIAVNRYNNIKQINIPLFYILYFAAHRGDIFATRQMLACAILFYAYSYVLEEKYLKFFLLIVIATCIHMTSIVFVITPLINKISLNKKKILFLICISILMCLRGRNLFISLFDFLGNIIPTGRLLGKIISYKNDKADISIIYIIRYLFFIPFFISKYKKGIFIYNKIFNTYLFGCLVFIITAGIMPVMQRFALYFTNFEALLICLYVNRLRNKNIRNYMILVFVFYACLKYIASFFGEYNNLYVPYYSIFNMGTREIY